MIQIDELQARISAAIERIGAGMDQLAEQAAAVPGPADPDVLRALEDERIANAQLEERLRALKAKHVQESAALHEITRLDSAKDAELQLLRSEVGKQAEVMARLDQELQHLRAANDQLRKINAALREANAEGVGEPHLINTAMLAELEGLRAARNADAAETGAILGKLEPLLAAAAKHLPDVPDAENEEMS
ncbi:MAG: hypothetical protein GDA36_03215 [Rhodobacteraceae bacterium]|nr:hypothetical protein [Paracoccaceae bacterium]